MNDTSTHIMAKLQKIAGVKKNRQPSQLFPIIKKDKPKYLRRKLKNNGKNHPDISLVGGNVFSQFEFKQPYKTREEIKAKNASYINLSSSFFGSAPLIGTPFLIGDNFSILQRTCNEFVPKFTSTPFVGLPIENKFADLQKYREKFSNRVGSEVASCLSIAFCRKKSMVFSVSERIGKFCRGEENRRPHGVWENFERSSDGQRHLTPMSIVMSQDNSKKIENHRLEQAEVRKSYEVMLTSTQKKRLNLACLNFSLNQSALIHFPRRLPDDHQQGQGQPMMNRCTKDLHVQQEPPTPMILDILPDVSVNYSTIKIKISPDYGKKQPHLKSDHRFEEMFLMDCASPLATTASNFDQINTAPWFHTPRRSVSVQKSFFSTALNKPQLMDWTNNCWNENDSQMPSNVNNLHDKMFSKLEQSTDLTLNVNAFSSIPFLQRKRKRIENERANETDASLFSETRPSKSLRLIRTPQFERQDDSNWRSSEPQNQLCRSGFNNSSSSNKWEPYIRSKSFCNDETLDLNPKDMSLRTDKLIKCIKRVLIKPPHFDFNPRK